MKKFQYSHAVICDAPPIFDARETLIEGFRLHQNGDLENAVQKYEMVLTACPTNSDALNLLGVIHLETRGVDSATRLLEKAVEYDPNHTSALLNLGNAKFAAGDMEGAIRCYKKALENSPRNADLHFNLANALFIAKRTHASLDHYNKAIELEPGKAEAWFNRSNLFSGQENFPEALKGYEQAHELNPNIPSLLVNWGCCLAKMERFSEAASLFQRAVVQTPNDPSALGNLGAALVNQKQESAAIPYLRAAIALNPRDLSYRHNLVTALLKADPKCAVTEALAAIPMDNQNVQSWRLLGISQLETRSYDDAIESLEKARDLDPESFKDDNLLGIAYSTASEIDKAINFYEYALMSRPDDAEAWADLAIAQMNAGRLDESIQSHRKSLELDPNHQYCHSNLLMILCYSPDYNNEQLLDEAKAWGRIHAPVSNCLPPVNRPRGSRLKIGYVSPDFHDHPAGRIYEKLFRYHDRSKYEISLYCNNKTFDEFTQRTVQSVDRWRLIQEMSDQEVADFIRADEIDVLIDLVGHTPNHRLKVFGLKPAPVQATWLGYFASTGMPQMDFIIGDEHLIPAELEGAYVERAARMKGTFYAFNRPDAAYTVNLLPAQKNGYVTFGSLNNTAKITPEVVALWSEVLKALPSSRMYLNRWPFQSPKVREHFLGLFQENGISGDRIEIDATYTKHEYFRSYSKFDIALDTFPFGAATTTTDAAWMGIPVVTLTTDRLAGRMTKSIYYQLGLQDWLPNSKEEFVDLALRLAADIPSLAEFRATMRSTLESSPMTNFSQLAKDMEEVFEYMWENRTA